MARKRRVFFVIPHLGGGGAERVLSIILKFLDRSKFELCLVVYGRRFRYSIPEDVRIIDLEMDASGAGIIRKAYYFFRRIQKIRSIIDSESPDVIFTMLAGPIPILAARLSRRRPVIVVRETTYVSLGLMGLMGRVHKMLVRIFYPMADIIISLTKDARNDLQRNFGVRGKKIRIIQNPVDIRLIEHLSRERLARDDAVYFDTRDPVMISVGRLFKMKGYQYLLGAFRRLLEKRNARLLILGEGPYEGELRKIVGRHGIGSRVFFLGFRENPFKFIRNSVLFVFPSLYEGFPNVLIESMACGTPLISTDCLSGPNEIIENGLSGILVPVRDEQSLCDAMRRLLDDAALRKTLSENGIKRAKDFDVPKVIRKYEQLLLSC